jgi:pimeloyl-ACP methyl ester carboxylesterase
LRDVEIMETEFPVSNETLRGHFVKPSGDGPFPGVCKFHGLPGSSDQVYGIAISLAAAGFLVLTFDFRGFRRSDGVFSLSSEIEDARAAITHLSQCKWAIKDWTGVYGASFGAAVAICAAAHDKRIQSICVRAPVYDTHQFAEAELAELVLNDIAHTVPDEMHGIKDLEKQNEFLSGLRADAKKYNPMDDIMRLSPRAVFITTGDSDALIDTDGVRKLYDRAKEPRRMVIVRGADHNLSDTTARLETERGIIDWFRQQYKEYSLRLKI